MVTAMRIPRIVPLALGMLALALVPAIPIVMGQGAAWAQQQPLTAQPGGLDRDMPQRYDVPDDAAGRLDPLGADSDSDLWRAVRRGIEGEVPIPDPRAGVMVQSEGENWRSFKNGLLYSIGGWVIGGITAVILLFFAMRGRIRIDAGPAGETIQRFNGFERFVHWLTAGSFIVLALTGLNMTYGRMLFAMDEAGDSGNFTALHETFAALTYYGKLAHNFIGYSFAVGVVLMIVIWIRHNLPNKHDVVWVLKLGGLFASGVHPPAKKFNAGQKVVFWVVVIFGISIVWSGVGLMFPYQIKPFAGTFAFLNNFGLDLPTQLTALEEMQLMQAWHAIMAFIFIAVIIGHIYIGSLGMQGAFDAVGTGQVDKNWAREHHSLWVAELEAEKPPPAGAAEQPAE